MGSRPYTPSARHLYRYFTNASSIEMDVDGNSNPVAFAVTNDSPANLKLNIERINFSIVDGGMGYGEFAGLGAVSSQGLAIAWYDENDVLLLDYTDGETIKANEDFSVLSGVDAIAEPAAGDDFLPIRWTLAKSGQKPVMHPGDYIQILVQDDLTNISKFRAMAQGYWD